MTFLRRPRPDQLVISIHIPRVGDDDVLLAAFPDVRMISIHIPRVGDDSPKQYNVLREATFQSTSPVWGMTSRQTITP